MVINGKHNCTFCEEKEKSLVEQVEAEARRPKLSLTYEPCIMKVHQSIGLEILKFCLDSVLSDKGEKLCFKESQEYILLCMKNDLLIDEPKDGENWPWALLKVLNIGEVASVEELVEERQPVEAVTAGTAKTKQKRPANKRKVTFDVDEPSQEEPLVKERRLVEKPLMKKTRCKVVVTATRRSSCHLQKQ